MTERNPHDEPGFLISRENMDNYSLGTYTVGIRVRFLLLTFAAGKPQRLLCTHTDMHINMYIEAQGPALHVCQGDTNSEYKGSF